MSQMIELSEEVLEIANRRADEDGISPTAWIEREIREAVYQKKHRSTPEQRKTAWDDFIGAAARLPKPEKPIKRTPFGEILIRKYRKQGLKLDYDTD